MKNNKKDNFDLCLFGLVNAAILGGEGGEDIFDCRLNFMHVFCVYRLKIEYFLINIRLSTELLFTSR